MTYLVVAGVAILFWTSIVTLKYREERQARKYYEKLYSGAAPICGHLWCKEPEEAMVHNVSNPDAHGYRPAFIVYKELSPIKEATRDVKGIFTDWKVK